MRRRVVLVLVISLFFVAGVGFWIARRQTKPDVVSRRPWEVTIEPLDYRVADRPLYPPSDSDRKRVDGRWGTRPTEPPLSIALREGKGRLVVHQPKTIEFAIDLVEVLPNEDLVFVVRPVKPGGSMFWRGAFVNEDTLRFHDIAPISDWRPEVPLTIVRLASR